MKIPFLSIIVYLSLPSIYLSSLIPASSGSLFDFIFLPILSLYALIRFFRVSSYFPHRILIYLYVFFIFIIFSIRLILTSEFDPLIFAFALRYLMPVVLLIVFADIYRFISRHNAFVRTKFISSLLTVFLTIMIVTMILSFANGIGFLGLGLSFPFYTSSQIDRHVYGPAVASLCIFSFLTTLLLHKLRTNKLIYLYSFVTFLLALLSSFLSGSRSVFAMFSGAFLYYSFHQISRLRFGFILYIFLLALPLLTFSFLLPFSFLRADIINEDSLRLLNRSLSFFQAAIDPTSDYSRSAIYSSLLDQ